MNLYSQFGSTKNSPKIMRASPGAWDSPQKNSGPLGEGNFHNENNKFRLAKLFNVGNLLFQILACRCLNPRRNLLTFALRAVGLLRKQG